MLGCCLQDFKLSDLRTANRHTRVTRLWDITAKHESKGETESVNCRAGEAHTHTHTELLSEQGYV